MRANFMQWSSPADLNLLVNKVHHYSGKKCNVVTYFIFSNSSCAKPVYRKRRRNIYFRRYNKYILLVPVCYINDSFSWLHRQKNLSGLIVNNSLRQLIFYYCSVIFSSREARLFTRYKLT